MSDDADRDAVRDARPRGLVGRWKAWHRRELLNQARIAEAFREGQIGDQERYGQTACDPRADPPV